MTMELFEGVDAVRADFGPAAVTIGKFDGVHAGHRRVLSTLRSVARERGIASAVVTFDRHPLSLLRPENCPDALISNAQKIELLEATGIDATLMLVFDEDLSALTPEEFVSAILVDALHAAVVLVGRDFRFGHRGAGSVETLERLGALHGFDVRLIDDVVDADGRRASSTLVRDLLGRGDVREAAELLGYLPTLRSPVVHGMARGRVLGYPTANLRRDPEGFVPADGVYAAWLTVDGERYPAAVSVGTNPTFGDVDRTQVEAHVIDATLDLYDHVVELSLVDYIRPMRRFDSADALAAQMGDDESRVRAILGVPARAASDAS